MGGILSKPKAPAPDPSIAESQRKQEEILAKQEARATQREGEEARKTNASRRARRTGGLRLLLNQERDDAQLGLTDTLGG
ncbi:MAG: hypothetical protein ACKVH1_15395 [Alphaproteobacteria bacterium]